MQTKQDLAIDELIQRLIDRDQLDTAKAVANLFRVVRHVEHMRTEQSELLKERSGLTQSTGLSQFPETMQSMSDQTGEALSEDFLPTELAHGPRSTRSLLLAMAEMHLKGVSLPDINSNLHPLGLEKVTPAQATEAARLMEGELSDWCQRRLGKMRYLMIAKRNEKVRHGGWVQNCSVLFAVGIQEDGHRRIVGVDCAMGAAKSHWETFLTSLLDRGMHDLCYMVSEDHEGLRKVLGELLPEVAWQRSQHHLTLEAQAQAPNLETGKRLGARLKEVWNAPNAELASARLKQIGTEYGNIAPGLSQWLLHNLSHGLSVFALPEAHRRQMRSTYSLDRTVQLEIKKLTQKIRIFPSKEALERLVRAILIEIDETWVSAERPYIRWDDSCNFT